MDTFKVYVVEDSPIIREALIERIEENGKLTVVGYAETAQDAIAGVRREAPDILVLDLHLRTGSGYDVLRDLMVHDHEPIEHVIMFTNHATFMSRQLTIKLGATLFYDKSMEFEEMLDSLHAWAEKSTPMQ